MSRHAVKTSKYEVVIGVDRPLNHVFASILDLDPSEEADDEAVEGFDPFSNYAPSRVGLQTAIHDTEKFMESIGDPIKIPATMREALETDLQDLLSFGGTNINYGKTHVLEA